MYKEEENEKFTKRLVHVKVEESKQKKPPSLSASFRKQKKPTEKQMEKSTN